jgi:hypothetical protein
VATLKSKDRVQHGMKGDLVAYETKSGKRP